MQRRTSTTNNMLSNEANSDFGPVRTMTYATHGSRNSYIRSEFRLIRMVPNILENNYFSDGSFTIILANGTSIYHISVVPRNPFSCWIPAGVLRNTLAPFLPIMNAPNFSVSLSPILWNWIYSVISYTPRFARVNSEPDRLPLGSSIFHTDLLAFQDQNENVNMGLSREVIFARMKCFKYELTEGSTSDNDMCCICLNDFSDQQIIGSADCQHTFHFDCISQWLMQKNYCPLCKRIALAIQEL